MSILKKERKVKVGALKIMALKRYKKIYYFNTDYWRKSGATNKICKEFNVKEVPSLIKIKSGKTVEKRDLSKFIEK